LALLRAFNLLTRRVTLERPRPGGVHGGAAKRPDRGTSHPGPLAARSSRATSSSMEQTPRLYSHGVDLGCRKPFPTSRLARPREPGGGIWGDSNSARRLPRRMPFVLAGSSSTVGAGRGGGGCRRELLPGRWSRYPSSEIMEPSSSSLAVWAHRPFVRVEEWETGVRAGALHGGP
jgi:hypothetical protein